MKLWDTMKNYIVHNAGQKGIGMEIVMVPIENLKEAEYNPRLATEKDFTDLKASIERFGLVDPIIANRARDRMNVVIGGHFRLKVAKDLGFETVPVLYVDIPDIEKEKELCLRLNRNHGEFDFDLLANNFDLEVLKDIGFNENELVGFEDKENKTQGYVVDCPHCNKKLKLSNRVKTIEPVDNIG